jgi:tRNA(adenine34) deaminase
MLKNFIETTEDCFKQVEKFPYNVNYMKENLGLPEEYDGFKIAYIDENIKGNRGVLLFIHGHPTWSYLWRHLIPYGLKNDYRVISIDLPGFGRSDKPLNKEFFNFTNYRNVILNFIKNLSLKNITLFLHEWGGTLGLTLPMEEKSLYNGVVLFNSYLGNSLVNITGGYKNWIKTNIQTENLNIRALMARTNRILNLSECNAYEAPYSEKEHKLALKMLPNIFPINSDYDGYDICNNTLKWWEENSLNQVLVIGGGRDPLITIDKMKALSNIISTDDQTHIISNAGHFVPEWGMEFGEELFEQLQLG